MKPYTHFTLEERICLEEMLKKDKKISEIANTLGRNKSTISREIKRNSNKQGIYNSWGAYSKSRYRRKACVRHKRIIVGSELYEYIVEGLKKYWSPEIIAAKWRQKHPNDTVAFATIYRALKSGLFKGLTPKQYLRRRGKLKVKDCSKFNTIHPEHSIHEWSDEIKKRMRFGDWEGDTVRAAAGKGGLLTLVDRKSRKLIAVKVNNFSSDTLYNAVLEAFSEFKPKSITFDNGSEFAMFKEMEKALNTTVYFADPHSPWQRGSNENINGLIRFFFPKGKGINFRLIEQVEIDKVVNLINTRPRFCLNLNCPDDVFCCT